MIGQEHGKVLGFLDRLWISHLSEKLSGSTRIKQLQEKKYKFLNGTKSNFSKSKKMIAVIPFVSRVVILDTALHVLEFIQNCKHVDEFAQGKQVSLRHKVFPAFSVTQTLHLTAKTLNCLTLEQKRRNVTFLRHMKSPHSVSQCASTF